MAPQKRSPISPILQSHTLVARFLKSQGYTATLAAFEREAADYLSPPPTDSDSKKEDLELKDVVEEYLSRRLKELELPAAPLEEELDKLEVKKVVPSKVVKTIRDGTNILTVTSGVLPRRTWDSTSLRFKSEFIPCIFTTSVDRTLKAYSLSSYALLLSISFPSPILTISLYPLKPSRHILAGTMEGSVILLDLVTQEKIKVLKDHTKYVVKTIWSKDGRWVATFGYDKNIQVYEAIQSPSTEDVHEEVLLEGEEPDELSPTQSKKEMDLVLRKTIYTKTNPEAGVFLPDSDFLVWTARDDHILHYVQMPGVDEDKGKGEDWAMSGYNMNENNDAWVSFSILHITLHPTLPLLSLLTSTTNSRLLLYPFHSARRLSTLFTTSSQSEYTTPRHHWFPDGTLFAVNSDDGIVRILDTRGKVRARVGAHGAAAPLVEEGEAELGEEERSERVRARRETERGSSVVKDVEIVVGEDGAYKVVSCGFDKSLRLIE